MQRGEISYYEELGVAPDASADQIHDAFRAMVKLLHPDQQRDPQLREIAERQMRRLNHIHSVLSDPQNRRIYDQQLNPEARPAEAIIVSRVGMRKAAVKLTWAGVITVSTIILVWLAADSPAARVPVFAEGTASANNDTAPSGNSGEIARLRAELRQARVELDAALREVARLHGTSKPRRSSDFDEPPAPAPAPTIAMDAAPDLPPEPPPAAPPVLTPPPALVVAPAPAAAVKAAKQGFAGFWFFMKPLPGAKKASDLYPPEFIEATITEQNGLLRGKYRSRYHVGDRAISPDVNFEFSGSPAGNTLTAPWKGMGGARGELTLRILSEGSMKVDWKALELGSTQALVTGTATLTRQIE
jgi:hypothetical protein